MGNITSVEEEEGSPEGEMDLNNSEEGNKNSSFSESLRLFQSIQVLANEEESAASRNETAESECRYLETKRNHMFKRVLK